MPIHASLPTFGRSLARGGRFVLRSLPSPRARIVLGTLIACALLIDFVFYTGFYASDDVSYVDGARGLVEEGDGPASLGAVRLGMTVPGGLVYALSGGSVAAIAWFHVLYHLALVVLAFILGRLYHDELTGLFAAALAAMSPIFYVYAGAILPDNPTAVWLGLVMLLLELARRRAAAEQPMGARAACAWHFAMGLLLGVAYACKETGLIMTVPAAACVIAAAPRLRDPVWIRNGIFMAAGLIAFLGIEALALRGATGEWLLRPTMVGEAGDILLERMSRQGGSNPIDRFDFALEKRLLPFAPLTTWLLLAGAVGYLLLRRRRLAPIVFFWWPLLYMTIGSTSFSAYRPSSIQTRYYAIVILPAALMTAALIAALLERWRTSARTPAWARGRAATAALVLALGAVAVRELAVNLPAAGNIYRGGQVRAFAEAYEIARTEYPQYPLVLSSYFGRRMRPLFDDEPPQDVYGVHGIGAARPRKGYPAPPYLLLATPDLRNKVPLNRLQPDVAAGLLAVICPAANRLEVIEDGLRRLFGKAPRDPPRRRSRPEVVIQLVQPADQRQAPAGIRAPVIAWKGAEAEVTPLSDGNLVSWNQRPAFYVQLFDRGSYKSPPTHPDSKLTGPSTRLRVLQEVRLVRGERASLSFSAFGYDADGGFVQGTAKAALTAGSAPVEVAIDLASVKPIRSFRVRTKVTPRSKKAGALVVGDPRVEDLNAAGEVHGPPAPQAPAPQAPTPQAPTPQAPAPQASPP
jgi:4-amino-4-deoxy-L-arabinose transferase-like glycosyltransferase